MVTSAPSENLSLQLYEAQNKTFKFGITKTLILHTRSIFFKGGHLTKIWSKKIFSMKTLSKLGALTVCLNYKTKYLKNGKSFLNQNFSESLRFCYDKARELKYIQIYKYIQRNFKAQKAFFVFVIISFDVDAYMYV
jgi:hypothetical protein